MKCEIIDGVVYMWGTPQLNDETDFVIRFMNENDITVWSFFVEG